MQRKTEWDELYSYTFNVKYPFARILCRLLFYKYNSLRHIVTLMRVFCYVSFAITCLRICLSLPHFIYCCSHLLRMLRVLENFFQTLSIERKEKMLFTYIIESASLCGIEMRGSNKLQIFHVKTM